MFANRPFSKRSRVSSDHSASDALTKAAKDRVLKNVPQAALSSFHEFLKLEERAADSIGVRKPDGRNELMPIPAIGSMFGSTRNTYEIPKGEPN